MLSSLKATGSGGGFQLVLVSLAVQDGVLRAGDGRLESFPRNADEVAADGLWYQRSGGVVGHQPRRRVVARTGSSATRVATCVGRLEVIDDQRTSFT